MKLTVIETPLPGLLVLETVKFQDERGFFSETYNRRDFENAGITTDFIQDNHSSSIKNVLRGNHFQSPPHAQAKLVRCSKGKIFDVAVDLRVDSPTFGKWHSLVLTEDNNKMFFIPDGFAHGFVALTATAEVQYKMSDYYAKDTVGGILWNDPDVNIKWPIDNPKIAEKDKELISFKEYCKNPSFHFKER